MSVDVNWLTLAVALSLALITVHRDKLPSAFGLQLAWVLLAVSVLITLPVTLIVMTKGGSAEQRELFFLVESGARSVLLGGVLLLIAGTQKRSESRVE